MHVNRILRGRRSPTEEDRNAPNTPPADPSAHPGQTEVALTHRPWASVAFLPGCSKVASDHKASVFNGDTRSRHRLQDVKKTNKKQPDICVTCYQNLIAYGTSTRLHTANRFCLVSATFHFNLSWSLCGVTGEMLSSLPVIRAKMCTIVSTPHGRSVWYR